MMFRFKLDESLDKGLRRIGTEQIERARLQLDRAVPDTAVHETRKCMKRLRALLRLVRSGIGEPTFALENARFRDIARQLSASRDSAVVLVTIERLAAGSEASGKALDRLRDGLAATQPAQSIDTAALAKQAIVQLDEAGREWHQLRLKSDGFAPIAEGLAEGQRRLRIAFRSVAADADNDETFHEWRKTVQLHWRHVRLIQAGWPEYFEARATTAKQVSELLGIAQDLTVMLAHVRGEAGERLTRKQARSLDALAIEQRDGLRTAARERCARLVAEGADGFARRAHVYWQSAAQLQGSDISEAEIETPQISNVLARHTEPPPETADKALDETAAAASSLRPLRRVAARRRADGRRVVPRGPSDRPNRSKR